MTKTEKINDPKVKCKTCNGRKRLPKFDWYDGKLEGSVKCWECNGGIRPSTMFDNY